MAKRDRLHEHDTGFVTLFARAPQLCAATLAGLGSALWLNVVGPFAGLVAAWGALILVNALAVAVLAVLAMLVTTAGTLLAADWRADAASRQASPEIDLADVEFCLPAETAARSDLHSCYLLATDSMALRTVFRAHRRVSPAGEASPHAPACGPAMRAVVDLAEPAQTRAVSQTAPTVPCDFAAASVSDGAVVRLGDGKAPASSLGRELLYRARLRVERAIDAGRLVANGGIWSEWLVGGQCALTGAPLGGQRTLSVVLGGDADRSKCGPGPLTGDGTVRRDEPPSCRGLPSEVGERTRLARSRHSGPSTRSARQARVASPACPDPVMHDNFGSHVPLGSAELDVIEAYLDQDLHDLLASTRCARDRKET